MMKRVILDTNIYGKIIREEETDFVIEHAKKSGFAIYGCDIIRKELRKTPKGKIVISANKKPKMRPLLVNLYRILIRPSHDIEITKGMEELASAHYISYRTAGGGRSRGEMMDDFRIVAAADEAKVAYNTVSPIRGENTPTFKGYGEFKNDIN